MDIHPLFALLPILIAFLLFRAIVGLAVRILLVVVAIGIAGWLLTGADAAAFLS